MESNESTTDRVTLAELQAEIDAEKARMAEEARESELAALKAELDKVKAERAADKKLHEDKVAELNIRNVANVAKNRGEKLNLVQDDIRLAKAVNAAGGPAYFNKLNPTAQGEAIGIDVTEFKRSEIELHFGKKSSSAAASQLAASNPSKYRRMRAAAKLLKIY